MEMMVVGGQTRETPSPPPPPSTPRCLFVRPRRDISTLFRQFIVKMDHREDYTWQLEGGEVRLTLN